MGAARDGWRAGRCRCESSGAMRGPYFPTSFQNCVSPSRVMRWPFSRRRLISISFTPPSFPAACSGLGDPAHDDGGLRRRAAVDDGAGLARGVRRLAPRPAQDAGEREVHAFQGTQDTGIERRRTSAQRLDQLVGALVPLPPLADAAVDDLLQVIAALERRGRWRGRSRRLASPRTSIPSNCPTW